MKHSCLPSQAGIERIEYSTIIRVRDASIIFYIVTTADEACHTRSTYEEAIHLLPASLDLAFPTPRNLFIDLRGSPV
jgi:hypothetical protein